MFAAIHRDLAEPDLACLPQRIAYNPIRILGQIVSRYNVVGIFVVERGYLGAIDELYDLKGLFRLQTDILDLVRIDQDEVVLGDLKTLENLILVNRPDTADHLFIPDRLAGGFVDLAEFDL
jgi:hypothetical protein